LNGESYFEKRKYNRGNVEKTKIEVIFFFTNAIVANVKDGKRRSSKILQTQTFFFKGNNSGKKSKKVEW
jgi:predicted nucleotidyltransferase